jgi:DNA-binding response OmpR family regulator
VRVLVIEDDAAISELLENVLSEAGYTVDTANTAGKALPIIGDTYSLVITDWRLPDGDGRLIADMAATLGCKTLIISGMPEEPGHTHPTLTKPFRLSEVVAAVVRIIGKPDLENAA